MTDRACIVLIKNNCILMVRQHYRGKDIWTFPGGRIEAGETPKAAAIREAWEETNLKVSIIKQLSQRQRRVGQGTYYCFQGYIESGELSLGKDPELEHNEQELKEVKWIPIQEIRQHEEVKQILGSLEYQ